MPTVVGKPQEGLQRTVIRSSNEDDQPDISYGAEALARKGILGLEYPLERGLVRDWKEMSNILSHLFKNVMKVDLKSLAVVFTEPSVSPTANKERFAQILFDDLNVPLHIGESQLS